MRPLTPIEQELYETIQRNINKYVNSKKRREELIGNLDDLVEELTNSSVDVDAVYEYFFGGSKK